jgi:hypothetical protein
MLRRTLQPVCLLLFCCLAAHAQDAKTDARDNNTGIVYGKNHVFAVTAPEGWVLDNKSGVGQGLHAVFYPVGSSWTESKAVMYVNAAPKSETLEKFIEGDVAEFRKNAPGLKVTDDETPTLAGKEKGVVKRFSDDESGSHEAVAYVEESKVVVMVVLTARTRKEFESALPAFRQLVSSYRFISDKVVTGNR